VGQIVSAESGPPLLHLKLQFRFGEVDSLRYRLGLDAMFPVGITVREDLTCVPLNQNQCRVNYSCGFGFPARWRGAVMYFMLRRQLDTGPTDSLGRLQPEAERLYAQSRTVRAESSQRTAA
jgi:hypothetical protein